MFQKNNILVYAFCSTCTFITDCTFIYFILGLSNCIPETGKEVVKPAPVQPVRLRLYVALTQ